MAPHSTGYTLVNFHGEPGDEADRARAWSPAVYERMRAAKSSYDPGNLLRFGHAITGVPSATLTLRDVRSGAAQAPRSTTTAAPHLAKGAGPPS